MSTEEPRAPPVPGRTPPTRIETARALIGQAIVPVQAVEQVALKAALGRVLATAVVAPFDMPAHDNAAMDGYALRAADLVDADRSARPLRVIGNARAGRPFTGAVHPGEAVRITTGAWIPTGADTVLPLENAREHLDHATPLGAVAPGAHLRRRGEDLRAGETALAQGRRLRPTDLGWLAALGLDTVTVRRRPRVAVLSTGDELARPGEPLAPGRIYDSNRPALLALLATAGVDVQDLGPVGDDPAALARTIAQAARDADVVLSSGGISVGEADFTHSTLNQLGSLLVRQVAMRPGRPFAFGRLGPALYVGLPGNPVAAVVAFEVLVRDALARLGGESSPVTRGFHARCTASIAKQAGRSEFPRARIAPGPDGRLTVTPLANQGTGTLQPLSAADCLILLGHDDGPVAAGDLVACLPLQSG